MGNGVSIRCRNLVESAIVTTWTPTIVPISSMALNSALATASLSGERRLARACSGGPVVMMKWVMLCFGEE